MNRRTHFYQSHPALLGGLLFSAASLILNLLMILFLDMAHVYDIVHIFPVVSLLAVLPSEPNTQFALLPLAVIIDGLVGLLFGFLLKRWCRSPGSFYLAITLSFLIYFIAICFQWIPII